MIQIGDFAKMASSRRIHVLSKVINATVRSSTAAWSKTWSHRRQVCVQRCLSTQAQSDQVVLSDSCVQHLQKLDDTLRIVVEGGGCSGFQYKFDLDSTVNQDDHIFQKDGVKVIVDTESLEFLKGCTIDYHEELIRSAFRIINNPQAEQGCSCGVSFALKM